MARGHLHSISIIGASQRQGARAGDPEAQPCGISPSLGLSIPGTVVLGNCTLDRESQDYMVKWDCLLSTTAYRHLEYTTMVIVSDHAFEFERKKKKQTDRHRMRHFLIGM